MWLQPCCSQACGDGHCLGTPSTVHWFNSHSPEKGRQLGNAALCSGTTVPHADLADVGPPGRVLWCLQGCEPPSEVGRDGFPLLLVFVLSHDCAGDFGFVLN